MRSRPSKETLGTLWIDDKGVYWEQVSYTDRPTASFRRLDDHSQRLSGVVGCLLLDQLVLCKPEETGA
jgi:hypothetical protein